MKRVLSVLCAVVILFALFAVSAAAVDGEIYDPAGDTEAGKNVRIILIATVSAVAAALIIFVVIKNFKESK